jgi:hypothetical protein
MSETISSAICSSLFTVTVAGTSSTFSGVLVAVTVMTDARAESSSSGACAQAGAASAHAMTADS